MAGETVEAATENPTKPTEAASLTKNMGTKVVVGQNGNYSGYSWKVVPSEDEKGNPTYLFTSMNTGGSNWRDVGSWGYNIGQNSQSCQMTYPSLTEEAFDKLKNEADEKCKNFYSTTKVEVVDRQYRSLQELQKLVREKFNEIRGPEGEKPAAVKDYSDFWNERKKLRNDYNDEKEKLLEEYNKRIEELRTAYDKNSQENCNKFGLDPSRVSSMRFPWHVGSSFFNDSWFDDFLS